MWDGSKAMPSERGDEYPFQQQPTFDEESNHLHIGSLIGIYRVVLSMHSST
jgi:hypothetical protein